MEEKNLDIDLEEEAKETIEEEQTITLTRYNKIILLVVGVFFYIFFLLAFLPYSHFLKVFLNQTFKNYKIEYSDLELGIVSPIVVKNLYFSNLSDILFLFENLTLKGNLWKFLLSDQIIGEVFISSSNIKIKDFDTYIKNLNGKIHLENSYEVPIEKWSGDFSIQTKSIEFKELFGPLKNFSLPEEQKILRNLRIQITLQKGTYTVKTFQVDSELFQINGNATGNLNSNLSLTTISGKICLTPHQNLEEKNPMIYSIYLSAGGSLGGNLCLMISNNFTEPKIEVEQKY
ncbi:MAG: type II secretion system protein GspN [Leptonema sp. (in: bacteria)]